MFLIGLLSTPLFYLLAVFSYILAISFGVFSNKSKSDSPDENTNNLKNYEVLSPEVEFDGKITCNFLDFLDDKNDDYSNNAESVNRSIPASFVCISPPDNEFIRKHYHLSYSLFNRPPPLCA